MNRTSVTHALLTTPALAVHDVACCGQPARHGELLAGDTPRLVLVRRGAFIVQRGDREHVADPCSAIVLWDRMDYRVRHPGPGGDDCVVIALDRRVAGRLLGGLRDRDVALPLCPRLQISVAAFGAAARRTAAPGTTEQAAFGLLAAIVANADQRAVAHGPTRQLVTAAIELIHRDLATNHEIAGIADELGCSTYHLMHAFRAELGQTLRAYRVRARLGVALHRLADGEHDLAGLAVELGFASHSHLTDTFVRALGAPPSQLRASLRGA